MQQHYRRIQTVLTGRESHFWLVAILQRQRPHVSLIYVGRIADDQVIRGVARRRRQLRKKVRPDKAHTILKLMARNVGCRNLQRRLRNVHSVNVCIGHGHRHRDSDAATSGAHIECAPDLPGMQPGTEFSINEFGKRRTRYQYTVIDVKRVAGEPGLVDQIGDRYSLNNAPIRQRIDLSRRVGVDLLLVNRRRVAVIQIEVGENQVSRLVDRRFSTVAVREFRSGKSFCGSANQRFNIHKRRGSGFTGERGVGQRQQRRQVDSKTGARIYHLRRSDARKKTAGPRRYARIPHLMELPTKIIAGGRAHITALALLTLIVGALIAFMLVPPAAPLRATVLQEPVLLPEFALVDQHGRTFERDTFAGQWSLVFFGFTNCPDICPVTLQKLVMARRRLAADRPAGDLPTLVFVSVDPGRDTPEIIRAYVDAFGDGVVGVSGDLAEIEKLTRALGIFHARPPRPDGGYDVDHSAAVLVMNTQGQFQAVFSAPHDVDSFVADVNLLMDTL